MRILFLSSWFPWPTDNGSKLRVYNLLCGLADSHEITLLSFTDSPDENPSAPEIRSICRAVQVVRRKPFDPNPRNLRTVFDFLRPTPRSITDTFSLRMAQYIQDFLSSRNYDLVIASQLGTACYSQYFRGTPALFEEVEVGLIYDKFACATSLLGRVRHGLTWAKHQRYLARLLGDFQACTVVSRREKQVLARTISRFKPIEVVPNFIDLARYNEVRGNPQPNTLIFTGSFRYSVNYDAMVWFLREVYPCIRTQVPEICLTITGDHADLALPTTSNVTLTGFVKDVYPLVASAWVSVVPIREGGGTRLKILESMALGTPVVSTSKGAEGLDICNGRHLLIADTPEDFAQQVVRLLRDPELRVKIVGRAHQLLRQSYDQRNVIPQVVDLVQKVGKV